MNRPSTQTLLMGHPLVGVPMLLVVAFVSYVYATTAGFDFLSLLMLLMAAWVANCMKQVAHYRAQQREWNALDPSYRPPQPIKDVLRFLRALLIGGPILAGAFWLFVTYSDPTSAAHWLAPLIVVALPILWLASVLRRRKRLPQARDWTVTQAVTRPQPAPSVTEAFASLPDYCRPLFSPAEQP